MSDTERGVSEEFNLNDPAVLTYVPAEVEAEDGEPVERVFPPPMEGAQWVLVFLREQREEGKPPVKLTPNKKVPGIKGVRVQANLVPRTIKVDEEGNEAPGEFLKDWYPNSTIQPGQTISDLGYIMKCAGDPFRAGMSNEDKLRHVEHVFAEAGEIGVRVPVYVQWLRSHVKVDDIGLPVEKDGQFVYVEVKGAKRIAGLALKEATKQAKGESDPEVREAILQRAKDFPFLFFDPHAGEERSVQGQVARLVTPEAVEKAEAKRAEEAAVAAGVEEESDE